MKSKSTALMFGTDAEHYPLDEQIVINSGVASFKSQVSEVSKSKGDLDFLQLIPPQVCWYGPMTPPIYPFFCKPPSPLLNLPTAKKVLTLLRASGFESEHIKSLDVVRIPYPGFHPETKNDEIHSDPEEQSLFAHEVKIDYEIEENSSDKSWVERDTISRATHKAIQQFVLSGHIYYVLVRSKPEKYEGFVFHSSVVLFAVGVSPTSGNLVGVVSHNSGRLCL